MNINNESCLIIFSYVSQNIVHKFNWCVFSLREVNFKASQILLLAIVPISSRFCGSLGVQPPTFFYHLHFMLFSLLFGILCFHVHTYSSSCLLRAIYLYRFAFCSCLHIHSFCVYCHFDLLTTWFITLLSLLIQSSSSFFYVRILSYYLVNAHSSTRLWYVLNYSKHFHLSIHCTGYLSVLLNNVSLHEEVLDFSLFDFSLSFFIQFYIPLLLSSSFLELFTIYSFRFVLPHPPFLVRLFSPSVFLPIDAPEQSADKKIWSSGALHTRNCRDCHLRLAASSLVIGDIDCYFWLQ